MPQRILAHEPESRIEFGFKDVKDYENNHEVCYAEKHHPLSNRGNPCATVSVRNTSRVDNSRDSASPNPLRNKQGQDETHSCSSEIQDQRSVRPLALFVGHFGDVISKLAMITLRYQIIQESQFRVGRSLHQDFIHAQRSFKSR